MKKDEVRSNFPACVKFADLVRDQFGEGVKITFMNEEGRKIGKPSPAGVVVGGVTGDMWVDKKKGRK